MTNASMTTEPSPLPYDAPQMVLHGSLEEITEVLEAVTGGSKLPAAT